MKRIWHLIWFIMLTCVVACGGEDGTEDIIDITSPEVVNTQPWDEATGVLQNTEIVVTYSEQVMLGKAHRVTVNGTVVDVSVDGKQLFVNASLEEFTDYTVKISGISILDQAKNYAGEFTFSFSTKTDNPIEISDELVINNPSKEAVNVYNFMKEIYGEKIISSAIANVSWNLNEAEWIKLHTGKYPAIATFDYIHLVYSPANWIDYSNITVAEDWWNNNGIVSACWHWNVPTYEGSGDYTATTSKTTFSAENALLDGTWENNVLKADLEKIAGYLKLLQEKNIPVVWRPLHEAAGNIFEYNGGTAWFWWGADGAEVYKRLWIYMFNYFETQGLNNLIWVWTTQTKDNTFYPGDDYVDIIGRDIYNNTDAESIASEFEIIQDRYPSKMVTFSECGSVSKISDQWSAGAKWSYFMPWYDYERTDNINDVDFTSTDHQHANANWWIDAFNQSYVITRDQMPNLK